MKSKMLPNHHRIVKMSILIPIVFFFSIGILSAAEDPIKIGVITSITGPAAPDTKDIVNAITMCIDDSKGEIAGRPIKLIIEDDGMKPEMGLNKARKLIMQDGVHVLTGILHGGVNGAVAPYVNQQKVPLIAMASSPTEITYKKDMPYSFRLSPAGTQMGHPFGEWVYKNLNVHSVVTLALDYNYGYDNVSAFQRTFEESGGKIIQKIWIPLNVLDFAPYISQINKNADGIFLLVTGSHALRFVKQFNESGLKGKMEVLCGPVVTAESVLKSMGDEALGYYSATCWSAALKSKEAQAFTNKFFERFGSKPSLWAQSGYCSTLFILQAIKNINGDVENKEKFLNALKSCKVQSSPIGPIEVDDYNSVVLNCYITKVERLNGQLQNTVIETIPKVSQFYKFDIPTFLKEPIYSRDYPPCKYCK